MKERRDGWWYVVDPGSASCSLPAGTWLRNCDACKYMCQERITSGNSDYCIGIVAYFL